MESVRGCPSVISPTASRSCHTARRTAQLGGAWGSRSNCGADSDGLGVTRCGRGDTGHHEFIASRGVRLRFAAAVPGAGDSYCGSPPGWTWEDRRPPDDGISVRPDRWVVRESDRLGLPCMGSLTGFSLDHHLQKIVHARPTAANNSAIVRPRAAASRSTFTRLTFRVPRSTSLSKYGGCQPLPPAPPASAPTPRGGT